VEEATKQRRRVKAWDAEPRECAVTTDESCRGAITDQAIVLKREIPINPL